MRIIKIGNEEFQLHYGQNSICALEDELNESISEIFARLGKNKVKFKDFRTILWAGLLYGRRTLTPEAVGDMCDKAKVKITDLIPECVAELNESFASFLSETAPEEADSKN